MSVLTKAEIMKAEEKTVNSGTFSFRELMLTAGSTAAKEITQRFAVKDKKIAVLCGKGNNGGDGCVIAACLQISGGDVTVVTPFGAPETENAKFYFERLNGINICSALTGQFDIIIDALFGIGYTVRENNEEIFNSINESNAVKIAIDIPSGIECDNGKTCTNAVKADLTLTFIALKPCLVLPDGSNHCGEVKVLDIGVKPEGCYIEIIKNPKTVQRPHNSHKGTYGTALLFCGCYGFAGAAMLSAKAALRSGLGIVKCVLPKSIYSPFTCYLPEAVCVPVEENKSGAIKFRSLNIPKLLTGCNAVLIGCGCGKSEDVLNTVEFLLQNCEKPLVLDADGINVLCDSIELLKKSKAPIILTPHPAEMARLCGVSVAEIEADRVKFAKAFATEFGCTLVLKGSNTLVADSDGNLSVNLLGNTGMATAGSGDVLAGVIVSLLAQGLSPIDAAKSGVYFHSLAGDKAADKRGFSALIASDIIEEL